MSLGLQNQFAQFSGMGRGTQFPDPFLDIASLSVPTNMRSALYWAEYVYSIFGTYRMAKERVISYFVTDPELLNASEDETDKWNSFLTDTLDAKSIVHNMLRNRDCFHGDTRVVTRGGVFTLREMAGKTADVLSEGGVYRKAEFKSFGRQRLLEVTFSDGRTVLATPGHEWIAKNRSGRESVVRTADLLPGYRLPRVVAPRPPQNDEFAEGVRHGFTFGDGHLYGKKTRRACAEFNGAKDAQLLPFFAGHGRPPKTRGTLSRVYGLPAHYKLLPGENADASYWYGFVCGFLAADGTVDKYGCALLTQKAKATIDAVAAKLPWIGMAAGPVRSQRRTVSLQSAGKTKTYDSTIHLVTLLKQHMRPEDFLLAHHRNNFEKNYKKTGYGDYVGVAAVKETGLVDEVFCCVEMRTHTMVVDNGVLTKQCYGNAFASVVRPFLRFLACPRKGCGYLAPLREVHANKAFNFKYVPGDPDKAFVATCPACKVGAGYNGPWKVKDEDEDDAKKIKIKIWNPHEIELLHDTFTEDVAYLWRIPEDYKRQLRTSADGRGNLFHLERAPKEVMRAVANNQIYRFHPDTVFHMREPTLAGVCNRGWGIPSIVRNFRQIWYVQVLRRYNEAIALDYIIPFRIITPAPAQGKTGGGMSIDPMQMYNGSDFRAQVKKMMRDRRRDPASMQILPFPVNFQMFGADANQLAPRDLLDQGMETLLNDAGTPVELYNGSLQLQTAPVALRLFESTWHHLVHDANAFLAWMVGQVSQILSWETVDCKLKRVTIADNLEKQMMAAQLMMSQQLSGSTVLGDLGYNWKKEQRTIGEEARYQSEVQTRAQEEMAQAGFAQQIAKGQGGGDPAAQGGAAAGGGGGGGDPAAAGAMGATQSPVTSYLASMGPNVPQTPEDMMQVADSLAQQLLGLPESIKDSELRKLKQYNQALHAMVKARMDSIRQETRNAAGNAAMGQAQQGGGQAPPAM